MHKKSIEDRVPSFLTKREIKTVERMLKCNGDFDRLLQISGLSMENIAEAVTNSEDYALSRDEISVLKKELEERGYYASKKNVSYK